MKTIEELPEGTPFQINSHTSICIKAKKGRYYYSDSTKFLRCDHLWGTQTVQEPTKILKIEHKALRFNDLPKGFFFIKMSVNFTTSIYYKRNKSNCLKFDPITFEYIGIENIKQSDNPEVSIVNYEFAK